MTSNIVIICDEEIIGKALRYKLSTLREVDSIKIGYFKDTIFEIESNTPDVLIIFSKIDNQEIFDFIKKIEPIATEYKTPILLVTDELLNEDFILSGFDAGVDDFVSLKNSDGEILMRTILCMQKNELMRELTAKNKLLTELTEAINALQAKKVEFFTSPDSPYVKGMEEYNKAKAEFLKTKIDVQIAVNNGEDVTVLNINLKLKEEAVKAVEKAIELAEAGIEATFDALIYSLEQVYKALEELEKEFPESINFEEKLTNAENYINGAKKEMFEKYESSVSKEKLDQMKANMKAQKEALKKTVEESKKAK